MAHAPAPGGHMTATQMKATARVQSEAMLDMLKTAKLHTAMADALLTVYETGTHHPSEMLDEMVHLLGRKRTPPVPSTLHLPLRSKAEYLRALDASSISKALSAVVAELDQYRRSGEPLPDNVVAFAKERMKAFSTAKKKEARKRAALAAAAVAVLEPPPPRAPRAAASKAAPPPRAAPPPPEPRRSVAEAERLAPAGSVSSDDADEARAEALAEVSAAAFALEAAEAAAADDEDDVDALADELAAEALLADEEEAEAEDAEDAAAAA